MTSASLSPAPLTPGPQFGAALTPAPLRDWRALLCILAAAVLAYGAALLGTFVYDDVHSVSGNPAIADLGNAARFFVDPDLFSATGNRMYRPVLMLSFALDHALGGGAALPFKLQSLLLHAGCAMLLFGLCRRYGLGRGLALTTALLFAVHPLASETVNLVSARSELLVLLGLLLGLHGHLQLLGGRRGGLWLVLLGTVVACGGKETGVLLPGLLLLQEWLFWPRQPFRVEAGYVVERRPRAGQALQRLWPAALLVVGYLLARRAMFGHATVDLGVGHDGSDPMSGHDRDLLTQLATMATLLPRAALQMLLPFGLSLDPEVEFVPRFEWRGLLGLSALLLLSLVAMRRGRARPLRCFGLVLAWLSALPWIVLPLNVPMAEHRLYTPLAGVLLLLADLAAAALLARAGVVVAAIEAPAPPPAPLRRPLPHGRSLLLGVLVLFGALAARRSLDYRDEASLWRPILASRPHCFRAQWGLGLVLLRQGDLEGACRHLARAAQVYPQNPSPRIEWVSCLLRLPPPGRPFLALALAEQLAAERPADPYCCIQLAQCELQLGERTGEPGWLERAERTALHCLQIGTPKGLVYRVAACSRQLRGDLDGALALLDQSIARGLDHVSVRLDRAELLRLAGRAGEAEAELQRALRQDPLDPGVQAALQRRLARPPR